MKKLILMALIIFISSMTTNVDASEMTIGKSGYWNDTYLEPFYTHVGHYIDNDIPDLREGVMWYKRKQIHDFQVSDHIYIAYEGDLYPEAISVNKQLSVGIQIVKSMYTVPPTTFSIQFGVEDYNMGIGYQITYSEILNESEFSLINYAFNNGNVMDNSAMPGAYVGTNNMTVAVYSKKIKVKVMTTYMRQTGPLWNVYWITESVQERYYDLHLNFTFAPITYEVAGNPLVQTGDFYLQKLDISIRGKYKAI